MHFIVPEVDEGFLLEATRAPAATQSISTALNLYANEPQASKPPTPSPAPSAAAVYANVPQAGVLPTVYANEPQASALPSLLPAAAAQAAASLSVAVYANDGRRESGGLAVAVADDWRRAVERAGKRATQRDGVVMVPLTVLRHGASPYFRLLCLQYGACPAAIDTCIPTRHTSARR